MENLPIVSIPNGWIQQVLFYNTGEIMIPLRIIKNGDTIEAPQDVYVPSDTTNGYTEYYDTQTYVPETDYQETKMNNWQP